MKTRKLFLFTMLVAALAAFGAMAAQAGSPKVSVCHIPPDDPANYHTIRISQNALVAHLAHGDLPDACNALCAEICDDGDACTIDDTDDCEQQGCPAVPEPVNCDDGLNCTEDTCDSASGCSNVALVCLPSDLCHSSACAEPEGLCAEVEFVCPDGEACNPDSGDCETTSFCGDGNVDPGEECDDANTTPGDGCDGNCQIEVMCMDSVVTCGVMTTPDAACCSGTIDEDGRCCSP